MWGVGALVVLRRISVATSVDLHLIELLPGNHSKMQDSASGILNPIASMADLSNGDLSAVPHASPDSNATAAIAAPAQRDARISSRDHDGSPPPNSVPGRTLRRQASSLEPELGEVWSVEGGEPLVSQELLHNTYPLLHVPPLPGSHFLRPFGRYRHRNPQKTRCSLKQVQANPTRL